MDVSLEDRQLLGALEDGLAFEARPYAGLAARLGLSEMDVIGRLKRLIADGVVRRFGVIVRHHELGYRANAMVVWDLPEDSVPAVGRTLATLPYITLCYRRPRRPPDWPYNLFCMIHGRDRAAVEALVEDATRQAGLTGRPREILFSKRRFKQRGARYGAPQPASLGPASVGS